MAFLMPGAGVSAPPQNSGFVNLNNSSTSQLNPNTPVFVPKKTSYATVMQKGQFPSKEQGLIFDRLKEVNIEKYIEAVGEIVQPKNVTFASIMSNNRVGIFLASKQLADEFLEKNKTLFVNNTSVLVRPLAARQTKVIIANVSPTIPHDTIEEYFESLEIRRVSAISFVKASTKKDEYKHVNCFRRQVYIHSDDASKVPNAVRIKLDDTMHTIFFESGTPKCFRCSSTSHFAKDCNHIQSSQETEAVTNPTGPKRVHSEISSSISQEDEQFIEETEKQDTFLGFTDEQINISKVHSQAFKKVKNNEDESSEDDNDDTAKVELSTDERLQPIKASLEQPNAFMDYLTFKAFFENSKGLKTPTQEFTQAYTDDTKGLVDFLQSLYPNLEDRSTKNRLTRLIKKIKKLL